MPMIEVADLSKVYGERTVVDGVSFSVEPGEIFGILGPNGAGKTTAVECVGGLRQRDGGTIIVAGMDPAQEGAALREVLGIQLQESRLPDKMRVIEALNLYASFYPEPHDPIELVKRLGLVEQRTTYFAKLSGGQKQRLSVALALIGNPRVAILDELTTGLDPVARREVWEMLEELRSTGVTLLLVSHFMEEAERLCDRVVVIDHGRVIAADTPESLAASVSADQRMSFLPSAPFDLAVLETLPEVHAVTTAGERVIVTGTDDVASAVIIALHERGISVGRLRVDQPSLDDAFVALTSNDEGPLGLEGHDDSMSTSIPATEPATTVRLRPRINWQAARAMLLSEGRLLARNPGVVIWTAVLPVAAAIILGSIPAVRKPSADLGGLSFFQIYQPILVFFAITLLAMQALPDVLTRYREMGVLKRLRTTPVSPALLLFAQLALILSVSIVCMVLMVVVPPLAGAPWPRNTGGFALIFLLGAWAMLGLGMVIASLFHNAKVAAGFGSFLFFVMQFFAGLWLPRPNMPTWLRDISNYTPSGAAVQGLTDCSIGRWPSALYIIVLAVWGAVASRLAIRFFSWE